MTKEQFIERAAFFNKNDSFKKRYEFVNSGAIGYLVKYESNLLPS